MLRIDIAGSDRNVYLVLFRDLATSCLSHITEVVAGRSRVANYKITQIQHSCFQDRLLESF